MNVRSDVPVVPLGEVATIERSSVQPSAIAAGTRYVGLEHIETGGQSLTFQEVSEGDLASTKFAFGPDHVLFGKLRPYLAKIVCPDFDGVCSTDILPILPGPNLCQRYLAHWLRTPAVVSTATTRATGINLPRLSPKELAGFEVPLPPLEEQRRIAAILDKADALRRTRKRALALLDTLTQSIFLEMFGDISSARGRNDVHPFGSQFAIRRLGSSGPHRKCAPSRQECRTFAWTQSILTGISA